MAMSAGTVAVADNETVTGSGLAHELYTTIRAEEDANQALPSVTPPLSWDQPAADWEAYVAPIRLKILRGSARLARAIASAVVAHITTNGEAVITTGDSGLQRADIGGTPSEPTLAPTATQTIGLQ
jgi:hypothetical protein